jgi:tetratricopeptide (TPR) repeat protein
MKPFARSCEFWRAPQQPTSLVITTFLAAAFFVTSLLAPSTANAQIPAQRYVPGDAYSLSFAPLAAGEYVTALQSFRNAAQTGVASTEGRWIDSICYHTMIAECLYEMGDLAQALEQYESALKLFLAHNNWMLRIDFPPTIDPSGSAARSTINWASSRRSSKLGQFPEMMLSQQGRLDNQRVVQQGGVVAPPELVPVRVHEIVRCTALALRRRTELLGPACQHDPLSTQLVAALSRRPAPPNHWSQSWISVQLGLAYAAAGNAAQAAAELQKSLLVGGQYDHPLTATALLELGKLSFQQEKFDAASTYFLEATLAAGQYDQYDVMDEAFRFGALTHMITHPREVYPPLERASAWARTGGSRPLQASLLLLAAENFAALGQTAAAASLLDQAGKTIAQREMSAGAIGARFQYQSALVSFQQGNLPAGSNSLAAAMSFQGKGSRRLFQIAMADKLYLSGAISPRIIGLLYDDVLREPTAADWRIEPMETLAVVMTPHALPMEHWLELTLAAGKDPAKALEISDRIRRHRFHASMPMGGRTLALRWLLEAPKESLTERAALQRQDLLVRYPTYAELSRQATLARNALRQMKLIVDDPAAAARQLELYEQLAKLSGVQELMLHDMALRREPSEYVFPPLRDIKDIQQAMPDKQLTLAFFATGRQLHVFALAKDRLDVWQVDQPTKVRDEVTALLRQIGLYDKNQALPIDQLKDETWRKNAAALMRTLTGKSKRDLWDRYEELVIVPDGILWYVPFAALPVTDGNSTSLLISKMRVRCAPTVGTSVPDARGHKPLANTAVVVGRVFPRDEQATAIEAFDDLSRTLPGATRLDQKLPAPSALFAGFCDRLVVLDDTDDAAGPLDWSPLRIDRGRPGSTLGSWLSLPWGGPEQIVLPAYHTAAENSLKTGGTGDEIFLTVCGMMATGTRTMLLSRWRTAGATSFDLTREFVQELPYSAPSIAWQRSVQLAIRNEIDPDREPRVKASPTDPPIAAQHPFFWSGYLLIDTAGAPLTQN